MIETLNMAKELGFTCTAVYIQIYGRSNTVFLIIIASSSRAAQEAGGGLGTTKHGGSGTHPQCADFREVRPSSLKPFNSQLVPRFFKVCQRYYIGTFMQKV